MSDEQQFLLPEECFENGVLREGIAERIERLQQAAHPRLANLRGLHKENSRFFVAWEPINGHPLSNQMSEEDLYRSLRELIDAVEGLHQLGLVHGNLLPENIIVNTDGVYLTNASPLLWTDPARDVHAILKIAHDLGISEIQNAKSLRELASALDGAYLPHNRLETKMHLRALAWAVALILLAIAAAISIIFWMHRPIGGMLQS